MRLILFGYAQGILCFYLAMTIYSLTISLLYAKKGNLGVETFDPRMGFHLYRWLYPNGTSFCNLLKTVYCYCLLLLLLFTVSVTVTAAWIASRGRSAHFILAGEISMSNSSITLFASNWVTSDTFFPFTYSVSIEAEAIDNAQPNPSKHISFATSFSTNIRTWILSPHEGLCRFDAVVDLQSLHPKLRGLR